MTAVGAQPMDAAGALYQRRALLVLPILVRQAIARREIFYSDLAREIGVSNPRSLNWVLGSVGTSLDRLQRKWGTKIPRIQALVVNRSDHLPGSGFMEAFVDKGILGSATAQQRRDIVRAMLADVFAYRQWDEVLSDFNLYPLPPPTSLLQGAVTYRGGGESEAHRALKDHVATHPSTVGLTETPLLTIPEFGLPSGDRIDVLFQSKQQWLAVEVKSRISPEADIARGIFQCLKYQSVLDAFLRVQARRVDVGVVLALGGTLTDETRRLATTLAVSVRENLEPTWQPGIR